MPASRSAAALPARNASEEVSVAEGKWELTNWLFELPPETDRYYVLRRMSTHHQWHVFWEKDGVEGRLCSRKDVGACNIRLPEGEQANNLYVCSSCRTKAYRIKRTEARRGA